MKVIEGETIGEVWKAAFDFICKNGKEVKDEDQDLLEYSPLYLIIRSPNEKDPIAESQSESIKNWMRDNFTNVKKIPELNNSWSYAWRLYDFQGVNQIDWIVKKLKNKPESKSATISMIQKAGSESYVPCVSLLDFKVRDGVLSLTATCRSLDFGKKAIHNFTNLAVLAKKIAIQLKISKAILSVFVISAHIYKKDLE